MLGASRAARRPGARARSRADPELRELIRAMLLHERIDDLVEVAFHDLIELVEGQVDPVVGHPPLREVVRADPLGAVAGADEAAPALGCLGLAPRHLGVPQLRPEQRHRPGAVLVLRALVLALVDDAGRLMRDPDRRIACLTCWSPAPRPLQVDTAQSLGVSLTSA